MKIPSNSGAVETRHRHRPTLDLPRRRFITVRSPGAIALSNLATGRVATLVADPLTAIDVVGQRKCNVRLVISARFCRRRRRRV